jgi:hypothetical protein
MLAVGNEENPIIGCSEIPITPDIHPTFDFLLLNHGEDAGAKQRQTEIASRPWRSPLTYALLCVIRLLDATSDAPVRTTSIFKVAMIPQRVIGEGPFSYN